MTVALAGRRIDAADATHVRFPQTEIAAVDARIEAALRDADASALVCAAACGADLIALRVARRCGINAWIVLPYAAADFRRTSVVDRGHEWGPPFDSAVKAAEEQGRLSVLGLTAGDDRAYPATNAAILDKALALSGGDSSGTLALVVWDGPLRGGEDYTRDFADTAQARGILVQAVPILEQRT